MIGDNLSSHLGCYVLKLWKDNNISLIAFPPHVVHLLQPHNVGVSCPMKKHGVKCLAPGKKLSKLEDLLFPQMLKKLLEEMKPKILTM